MLAVPKRYITSRLEPGWVRAMWLQCTCRWEWSEGRQRKVKDGHWEKQENEKQSRWASLDHVLTMAGGGASRVFGSLMPTCKIFHRLKVSDQGFWLSKKKLLFPIIIFKLCYVESLLCFPVLHANFMKSLWKHYLVLLLGKLGGEGWVICQRSERLPELPAPSSEEKHCCCCC